MSSSHVLPSAQRGMSVQVTTTLGERVGNVGRFSTAQSYYTIFYLAQALLLTKDLTFSSHSAVVAAYGKEFAKTNLLDPKFHRYIIETQKRRQTGHYGEEGEEVTEEQAMESFQWAEEFMQAVKEYLRA